MVRLTRERNEVILIPLEKEVLQVYCELMIRTKVNLIDFICDGFI